MTIDTAQLVTYRPCPKCGFRLMRSERMQTEEGEDDIHANCPICGRETIGGLVAREGACLSDDERYRAWLAWLQKTGLTPETLRRVYHLEMRDFFQNQRPT